MIIFFQVTNLFLGVSMDEFEIKNSGIGLMIGWTSWIIVFAVFLEVTRFFERKCNLKFLI